MQHSTNGFKGFMLKFLLQVFISIKLLSQQLKATLCTVCNVTLVLIDSLLSPFEELQPEAAACY